MIKTVIIPENDSYNLTIPDQYIGKKVEILLYSLDEVLVEENKPRKTMADFNGILSEKDYQALKNQTEQARQ